MTCAAPIRAHQLGVACTAHSGDLGAQRRRDLDGVSAHPAAGPDDEHPLPGSHLTHLADPAQAVVAATGTAAACSKVRPADFGTTRSAAAHAYSANAPRQKGFLTSEAGLVVGAEVAAMEEAPEGIAQGPGR
jgi:hypothetical protein